jgi:hypothetical protein
VTVTTHWQLDCGVMNTKTVITITAMRRSHGSGLVTTDASGRRVTSTAGSMPHHYR